MLLLDNNRLGWWFGLGENSRGFFRYEKHGDHMVAWANPRNKLAPTIYRPVYHIKIGPFYVEKIESAGPCLERDILIKDSDGMVKQWEGEKVTTKPGKD